MRVRTCSVVPLPIELRSLEFSPPRDERVRRELPGVSTLASPVKPQRHERTLRRSQTVAISPRRHLTHVRSATSCADGNDVVFVVSRNSACSRSGTLIADSN